MLTLFWDTKGVLHKKSVDDWRQSTGPQFFMTKSIKRLEKCIEVGGVYVVK